MAFKRSAVRLRLAPPNSLKTTESAPPAGRRFHLAGNSQTEAVQRFVGLTDIFGTPCAARRGIPYPTRRRRAKSPPFQGAVTGPTKSLMEDFAHVADSVALEPIPSRLR